MKKLLTGALALVLFTTAQAQTRDTSGRHHKRHDAYHQQLNLSADQQAKLKSLHEAQRREAKALRENASLAKEQQKAQREALHKKYEEQANAIYTPAQRDQLQKRKAEWKEKAKQGKKEGRKGAKGVKAKRHHKGGEFGKELNLSEAQKSAVARMREESKAQLQAVQNDASLSDIQKKEKIRTLRTEQQEQFRKILTKEQIEKMESARKSGPSKKK